jgi:hypothetical protein
MTEFQQMIETLIDQLLLMLPLSIFVDFPLLNVLLANPNGRYVLAGLVIVISFIGLWVFLRIAQVLFDKQTKPYSDLDGCSAKPDATNLSEAVFKDEFRFLKRADVEIVQSDDDQALVAIEQEMLAIKQLFADGHILKDVYVTETRRLYIKAKALRS